MAPTSLPNKAKSILTQLSVLENILTSDYHIKNSLGTSIRDHVTTQERVLNYHVPSTFLDAPNSLAHHVFRVHLRYATAFSHAPACAVQPNSRTWQRRDFPNESFHHGPPPNPHFNKTAYLASGLSFALFLSLFAAGIVTAHWYKHRKRSYQKGTEMSIGEANPSIETPLRLWKNTGSKANTEHEFKAGISSPILVPVRPPRPRSYSISTRVTANIRPSQDNVPFTTQGQLRPVVPPPVAVRPERAAILPSPLRQSLTNEDTDSDSDSDISSEDTDMTMSYTLYEANKRFYSHKSNIAVARSNSIKHASSIHTTPSWQISVETNAASFWESQSSRSSLLTSSGSHMSVQATDTTEAEMSSEGEILSAIEMRRTQARSIEMRSNIWRVSSTTIPKLRIPETAVIGRATPILMITRPSADTMCTLESSCASLNLDDFPSPPSVPDLVPPYLVSLYRL
jgi:hypothetical protein